LNRRNPVASATAAVGSYFIPDAITEIWEPQRDFAFAKLAPGSKGFHSLCAIGGGPGAPSASSSSILSNATSSSTASATSATPSISSPTTFSGQMSTSAAGGEPIPGGAGGSGGGGGTPFQLMVVTSAGYFYQYGIDMENGGECMLLKEFSFLDADEEQ
jgi:hypothetical protein